MELTPARDEVAIESDSVKSCRRCGEQIRGRRRNGYCSDRCRLADNRDAQRRKQLELLAVIDAVVQQLRAAIQG